MLPITSSESPLFVPSADVPLRLCRTADLTLHMVESKPKEYFERSPVPDSMSNVVSCPVAKQVEVAMSFGAGVGEGKGGL